MTTTNHPIDVFISYKREDRETAKALAEALAHRGYSVWWDIDLLPGDRFVDAITEIIKRAKVTVVLWSKRSVASDFVRAEADLARQMKKLIPARLDHCEPPIPFTVVETLDLTHWRASDDETLLVPLFNAIEAHTGKAPTAPQQPAAAADNLHRQDLEAQLWRSISEQRPQVAAEYDHYLDTYPEGNFTVLARMRLANLRKARPVKTTKNAIIAVGGVAAAVATIIGLLGPLSEYLPSADPSEPEVAERQPSVVQRKVEPTAGTVVADRNYQPGDRFDDCGDEGWCPEMVVVPAGSFLMGSPEEEEGRRDDEGPLHRVTIAEPFAIGVHEVTFAEWDACAADASCNGYRPRDHGWGRDRQPVINVSWHDARAYVQWLSNRTGRAYRLPSEAEWEYAARAGTRTRYAFGDAIKPENTNYGGTIGKTTAAGWYTANAWRLHDMHGNVWEWVEDCWNDDYTRVARPNDGSAWRIGECGLRVLRGGSWTNNAWLLRSAVRSRHHPTSRNPNVGFRVAMTLR